jgi:hypothetical protein
MTRFESFEADKRRINIVTEHCDPDIAAAVVVCLDSLKPNDSLSIGVRSRSVPAKIAKHLDPVLADFAHRNEVPITGWIGLSELVLNSNRDSMDLTLHMWGRQVIARADRCGSKPWNHAAHTVDTLRNFVHFCRSFRPTRDPIQVYQNGINGKPDTYDIDAQRIRPHKDPYPRPIEFFFDEDGWCELCCSHTATEKFRLEKIAAGERIDPELPLYVPSLSSRFCADHASTEGKAYKRDVPRREYWHAMMRALIEARLAQGIYALDFKERRAVTYDLVFPQKSILPSVKAIHDYVKNSPIRLNDKESRAHLLELLRLTMVEVKKASK